MSRRGLYTEEWASQYLARHFGPSSSGTHTETSTVRRPSELERAIMSANATDSPLVRELAGHLRLLGFDLTREARFHPERRWRFDLADEATRVGVECDGAIFNAENGKVAGGHARGASMLRDMEKRNAAVELGWAVLVFGPPTIRSGEAARQIERVILSRRVAQPASDPSS